MTTFSQYKDIIREMADDTDATSLSASLIYNGYNAALRAIANVCPKRSKTTITGTDTDSYALPDDFFAMDTITDDDGDIMLRYITSKTYIPETGVSDVTWFLYPEGYITFTEDIDNGDELTMYYYAYWSEPSNENDDTYTLPIPKAALYAVSLYTLAYCIMPSSVSTADIRRFATRIDSGTPIHNPMKEQILFLYRLYDIEVERLDKDYGMSRGF